MSIDPEVAKQLTRITEETGNKREDRLRDKWPEYRETDSSERKREILVNHYRLAAIRWAKVWLPSTADKELRQVEKVTEAFLAQSEGFEGSEDEVHRRTVQGLINLGNSLAKMLRAIQGSNEAARLAVIEDVTHAVASGEGTAVILERANDYQPEVRKDEGVPDDVRD